MEDTLEKIQRLQKELEAIERETLEYPDGEYKEIMLGVIQKRHRQLRKEKYLEEA